MSSVTAEVLPISLGKFTSALTVILLSQEAMTLLGVKEGDHLYLSDTPDGELRVALVDPQTVAHLRAADRVMDEDWYELQTMAKGK